MLFELLKNHKTRAERKPEGVSDASAFLFKDTVNTIHLAHIDDFKHLLEEVEKTNKDPFIFYTEVVQEFVTDEMLLTLNPSSKSYAATS